MNEDEDEQGRRTLMSIFSGRWTLAIWVVAAAECAEVVLLLFR
jgi:hypothetical protein